MSATKTHLTNIECARQVLHRWEHTFQSGAAAAKHVRDNVNVPTELHGTYVVTGKQFTQVCGNLVHALVELECNARAKNIWKETGGIRSLVVTW